jgi:transcriptional regulator GlxA family with amidase domain
MRELAELEVSRLPTAAVLQRLVALRALHEVLGEAELAAGGPGTRSDPVQRALAAIEDGLAGDLDVDALAAAAAVSRAHLMRLFARELGTTPMAYVWRRRTERGLRLLEASGLPVAEVADRCGFATAQHFARRVKVATGTTPAGHRARTWGGG